MWEFINKIISQLVLDLSEYWKSRGPGYKSEFNNQPKSVRTIFEEQERKTMNLIQKYKFSKILEVGCGSGRYTKILHDLFKPERYLAVDISIDQIENAKKYVGSDKVDFQCSRIQDLNINEKFELVFASEVLMHIQFNDINDIIKKLISYSSNKIISIDWFDKNKIGSEASGYCFMHDYEKIFKKNGAKKITIHKLPLTIHYKMTGIYAKLRGRHGIDTQAIIEIDV